MRALWDWIMFFFGLILFLICIGILGYIFGSIAGEFLGFGKDLSFKVKSHYITSNARVIELEIENSSQWWQEYNFFGGDISVDGSEFSLLNSSGDELTPDGRSEINAEDIRSGRHKTVSLVFINPDEQIENYDRLDFYLKRERIEKEIKLPEAEYVKSNLEQLWDLFFNKDKETSELKKQLLEKEKTTPGPARQTDKIADSNSKQTTQTNWRNYEGNWGETNIVEKGGSSVTLHFTSNNIAELQLITAQSPPSSRIADVETNLEFNNDGIASFQFAEDGWGGQGQGTVTLQNNSVSVEVKYNSKADDWNLYEGNMIFGRNTVDLK
ncbi:hypothetical protein [Fictibacillus sp. KU28468]|uniref:hypothetical protein n=1 Tax=Fictibacillus sp. KU28468 TaxID=2991053 RepID=UPI00223DAAC5|nr:hypothetical protein [Fictibacillus sp. KU28468]UZJ79579.1 hypothetical protein OKX00_03605 [Fictibacillus sp. KU28468]